MQSGLSALKYGTSDWLHRGDDGPVQELSPHFGLARKSMDP